LDYDPATGWLIVYDAKDWGKKDLVRFYDFVTMRNIFNFEYGPAGLDMSRVGIWIDDNNPLKVYIVHFDDDTVKEWNIEQ
jgi:hypothetical protein